MIDTKAAFEKWVKTVMYDTDDFHQKWGMYTNLNVRIRWEAWQASRAEIKINLDFIHPLNFDLHKIEEEITSHGIRIKGKT